MTTHVLRARLILLANLIVALGLARSARADLELSFEIDQRLLVQEIVTNEALDGAAPEHARALRALQRAAARLPADPFKFMEESRGKSFADQLAGVDEPASPRLPIVPLDRDAVTRLPEYALVLEQTHTRLAFCERQWREHRAATEKLVRDLTGLTFGDRTYRILILHPALPGGLNMGNGVIEWGGREEWHGYTTTYLWHEILHDFLHRNDLGHVLVLLVADDEVRHRLDPAHAERYVGHDALAGLTSQVRGRWTRFKARKHRDILALQSELERLYPRGKKSSALLAR